MQLQVLVLNTATAVTNIFNKQEAFKKLANSKEFKNWHRAEVARRLGRVLSLETDVDISRKVDEQMKPENLKIEEGLWHA